ncbi:MAG: phenylalanine--tRNA ligase subunit alpha [Saprospiraceae bacterium]|nr:phenylalanine--tRNA ligase subunit alpha [Saprospiraceae bacterium]
MSDTGFEKARKLLEEIKSYVIDNEQALESFRIEFVGAKSSIKSLFGEIKNIPDDKKKEFGQFLNEIKNEAERRFEEEKSKFASSSSKSKSDEIDLSRPADKVKLGARHPISIVSNRIIEIFTKLGFAVAEDREIEDDWHNFTSMNTPEDHPARDMQDTFYLKDSVDRLLRTHTSSVQSRVMTSVKPPIRIIAPGRVYRNETISSRSHAQFHQVEGLYIDEGVSFADLKQTLLYFAQEMYGKDTKIRLRPSYFPFTEPSAEMDVYWGLKDEIDYRITKGTGWLEILGCGMVDPNVLKNCDIDPEKYSGFAFGMGIERQCMLKYRIDDIRSFFENDIRFLEQFKPVF